MKNLRKSAVILAICLIAVLSVTLVACHKTEIKTVNSLSENGVTAEGEFVKDSTLKVSKLSEVSDEQKGLIFKHGYCAPENLTAYDIHVENGGAKVQPNGKVKITVDAPHESANGFTVFHFKSAGEVEALSATLANGKLSFETTSFSVFVIGENSGEVYSYDVEFVLDGGNFVSGANIPEEYGNLSVFPITLPVAEKSGYTFKGWKNAYGVEMKNIDDKMRGDITLTAQWEKSEDKEFFLFRLEMDKVDQNDSNIKTIELYSTRVSDGKGEVLKSKIDGSFENVDRNGMSVSIGGGTYIDILSDTAYKNCTAGTINQETGNHGFCYYDGSFSGKISINEDYMLYVLKKIDGETGEDRLEAVTTDNFQTLSEGRYFVVRKDAYNAAIAAGKNNETGELYEALSYLSEPHDDGKDNPVIEDITACYEIWIQFATSLKIGN